MGFIAFNASDWLPPKTMAAAPVMMDRTPSHLAFYQLCLGSWGKVHGSLVAPSVTSRRVTPRNVIVNASTYGPCPICPTLEAIRCSPRKEPPGRVRAPTTLDATSEELHAREYKYRSITRRQIGTRAREHTHHHRQVHCNKTHRATPV